MARSLTSSAFANALSLLLVCHVRLFVNWTVVSRTQSNQFGDIWVEFPDRLAGTLAPPANGEQDGSPWAFIWVKVRPSRTWSNHFRMQFRDESPRPRGDKLSPPRTSEPVRSSPKQSEAVRPSQSRFDGQVPSRHPARGDARPTGKRRIGRSPTRFIRVVQPAGWGCLSQTSVAPQPPYSG